MALNTFKCNQLTSLPFKGLNVTNGHRYKGTKDSTESSLLTNTRCSKSYKEYRHGLYARQNLTTILFTACTNCVTTLWCTVFTTTTTNIKPVFHYLTNDAQVPIISNINGYPV